MPRILHLITGLETGGAERMLTRLVIRMDRARFPCTVVSLTGAGAFGPMIADAGVRLYSLGLHRGRPDPRAILRLLKIIRACRPDVLQTWLYHADMLGSIAWCFSRVPHLVWNVRCTESTGNSALRWLLGRASTLPETIIVNAEAGKAFHQECGYRPRRWVQIPNGFDTSVLHPDADCRRRGRIGLGLGDDETAIILPARFDSMKDHATYFEAAAILAPARPDARFFLCGSTIDAGNRALAEAISAHGLGPKVTLLGERRDLEALYPAFDLVTLSSAYGEGFPNVLGEAMACGVPCVATDTGDCAAIIGDTGAIVPPRDPHALAAAWQRLMALGPEGRRALSARARARIVQHFDLGGIVQRYEALYDEIAG